MYLIHEGVPGSGKSYDAVKRLLDVLKTGRVVYTNIDGVFNSRSLEAIASYTGLSYVQVRDNLRPLDNQTQVKRFWEHVKDSAYIIIDEAQLYWSSRDYQLQDNKDHAAFASTHRHHGYDVLVITQRAERIDSALRALVEWRYRYRKLSFMGSIGKKGYLCYSYNGDDPKVLSTRKGSYDPKIFMCYASYVGDSTEKQVRKPPNIFMHPIFFALAFILLGFGYSVSRSSFVRGDVFGVKSAIASSDPGEGDRLTPLAKPGAEGVQPVASPAIVAAVSPSASSDSLPPLVVLGYINGKPVFKHTASGRVIVSSGIPRIPPGDNVNYF